MRPSAIRTPCGAEATRDLERGDELTGVPRRMLGRVDDQAEHGGRDLGAADRADLAVGRGRRASELGQRAVDPRLGLRDQLGRAAGLALALQRVELRRGELLASGIRQEALQAPGEMPQMEARRRGTAGARPEIGLACAGCGGRDVLAAWTRVCAAGISTGSMPGSGPRSQTSGRAGSAHAGNLMIRGRGSDADPRRVRGEPGADCPMVVRHASGCLAG